MSFTPQAHSTGKGMPSKEAQQDKEYPARKHNKDRKALSDRDWHGAKELEDQSVS